MDQYGFMEPLRDIAAKGKPMFGTCAGLILLAKEVMIIKVTSWFI